MCGLVILLHIRKELVLLYVCCSTWDECACPRLDVTEDRCKTSATAASAAVSVLMTPCVPRTIDDTPFSSVRNYRLAIHFDLVVGGEETCPSNPPRESKSGVSFSSSPAAQVDQAAKLMDKTHILHGSCSYRCAMMQVTTAVNKNFVLNIQNFVPVFNVPPADGSQNGYKG